MADLRKNKKEYRSRRPEREFSQKMVDLARVTRVMKGGKRMSFRALVVVGDKKGQVGFGLAKGADVQIAMTKAVRVAEKSLLKVPLTDKGTIPHEIKLKFKSAEILLKPAPPGTGAKAGGALRAVLILAGIENVVGKQLGSSNKITNVKAAFKALAALKEKKSYNKPVPNNTQSENAKGPA